MKLTTLHDGIIEVAGDGLKWRLATTARGAGSAGPGYVHRLEADGKLLLDDTTAGRGPINDPNYGGLGTFGWQHARRLNGEHAFIGSRPWHLNNAWPIDGRAINTGQAETALELGFGIAAADLISTDLSDPNTVTLEIAATFRDPWQLAVCEARWRWYFARRSARLHFRVHYRAAAGGKPSFAKEHKLGFRLARTDALRSPLATWRGALPRTGQARPLPQTFAYVGTPLRLEVVKAWPDWIVDARARERFGPSDSPADGVEWDAQMRQAFELIRRDNGNATILLCSWQGGRGPYDQEPLSRRIVAETRNAAVELKVVA